MIVIVYPQFYGVGGIARYLHSFLANIPPGSGEITLLTSTAFSTVFADLHGVKIVHISVPENRLGLFLWGIKVRRYLYQLWKGGRLSCVNLHIPPLIPGLFIGGSFPVVTTFHTTYLGISGRSEGNMYFESPWSRLSVWLKVQMERYILSKSNLVIGLTEQSRNELLLYGRDRGVMVLPNGVDLSLFSTAEGVDAKEFDIVFAGRIEMMKGSRTIPSVCRALVRSKSDIRIAVIGYGTDQRCVFEALAPLAANVFLVGKVPFAQMVEYYRRSRVYVSTSYYEGLPGTCLEAMAMGLPAVVWDRPFYRGLVVNGKTGFTLEPGDVDQMVSAVMRLLGSAEEAHAMGQRARELVLESYDWRRLAPQLLEALSSVSKKRKVKRAMA